MTKRPGDDLRPFLLASHTVPPAEAFPTLKKAAIGKAGQPVYVSPWKWLFRYAGILLGIPDRHPSSGGALHAYLLVQKYEVNHFGILRHCNAPYGVHFIDILWTIFLE